MTRRRVMRTTGVVSACLASVIGLGGTPAPALSAPGACSNGLVALTFDDGPAVAVTGRLLDVLTANRVPATFFVVGERVAAAPWLTRAAYRGGFVIANHTHGHELLTNFSDGYIRGTLVKTHQILRGIGVVPSRLMRPPYGAINPRVRAVVSDLGLTPVLWDIDPRDWEPSTSGAIAARVLGALRPHERNIVLLHDGVRRSPTTLQAVPAIIRGVRQRGYCFARLGPSGQPVRPVAPAPVVPVVPVASVSGAVALEGQQDDTSALRFTVRLDRPTSRPVSLRVRTVERTATAGADYRTVDARVTFSAGETQQSVKVRVRDDRVDETRDRVELLASEPRGLRLRDRLGVGMIRDDDPRPRVRLTDVGVFEPTQGSATGMVRVDLDRPSSRRVLLELVTLPLEADESDYVPFEATRAIAPGQQRLDVPVEVLTDTLDEPPERFRVRVLSATRASVAHGTSTVTITQVPPQSP